MQSLKDRHVVVTGGTGALGSAVVKAFIEAGATCHIPAIESTPPTGHLPDSKQIEVVPPASTCRTRPRSTASTPSCRRCMPW